MDSLNSKIVTLKYLFVKYIINYIIYSILNICLMSSFMHLKQFIYLLGLCRIYVQNTFLVVSIKIN